MVANNYIIQNKSAVHLLLFWKDFDTNDWCKPIGIMFGNKFSIFEAIYVWKLWKPIAPDYTCCTMGGMWGFYYPPVGRRVELFFLSHIHRVDRDTTAIGGRWWKKNTYKWWILMDFGTRSCASLPVGKSVNFHPVSSCGKTLPERFRNSIRNRHFPVIFHIASLNLFFFLFSKSTYVDRWVTST